MLAELGRVLADADFTESGINAALGLSGPDYSIAFSQVPLLEMRLRDAEPGPLTTLIRLFVLGAKVSADDAAGGLEPIQLDELGDLLDIADGAATSPLRLTPYAGFVLAHDAEGPHPPADFVMGIGPATRTLAGLTLRQPVRRALDVGSGCGVQALLASRHADHVVAVELNPRGVWLTQLNAALNGVNNVEVRLGSLFEPVAGLGFDLIVSNPPFVISPDSTYVFRDSGQPGDTLSRAVVAQSANALREGGFAHVLCNWVHRVDQDWWEPLTKWVEDSGCDALLLHYRSEDGLTYTAKWHLEIQASEPEAFASTLDRWHAYYRRSGIERIASGAVILRRRTSGPSNWIRHDEMPQAPVGCGNDHALRVFQAYDTTATHSDLLGLAFRLVDNHRLTQQLTYRDATYTLAETIMAPVEGIGFQVAVPASILPVIFRLDGQRTLQQLVDEVAAESGAAQSELVPAVLNTARELFTRGLIAP